MEKPYHNMSLNWIRIMQKKKKNCTFILVYVWKLYYYIFVYLVCY